MTPFLQGTVTFPPSTSSPLPIATITLYNGSTQVATTTTSSSDGGYVFNSSNVPGGLTVGTTYTLTETPPSGYSVTSAQALSSIDPAAVTPSNSIQVTVVNPNAVIAQVTSAVEYGPSNSLDGLAYSFNGVQQADIFATQLDTVLSGAANVNTAQFPSMCVGVNDRLSGAPSVTFATVIDPQSAFLTNGGEIAYLYNHYGATLPNAPSLPAAVQSFPTQDVVAGVQVAIWELEYGSAFQLNGYDPNHETQNDYNDVVAAAAAFITDATGKSEKCAVLDASLTGSLPTFAPGGGQSLLASESLNFGNTPTPTVSISGVKYLDVTGVGLTGANNSPPAATAISPLAVDTVQQGVTIDLLKPGSSTVIATSVTNANGAYSFTGLVPGTYVVEESIPSGYVQTSPVGGSYTVVATTAGQSYTNYNFSDFMAACNSASLTNIVYKDNGCVINGLSGNTHQGDTVSVTFTVPKGVTETLSLVAYEAPDSYFNASDAYEQTITDDDTGTFTAGTYTLTVTLPNSYYQVDFVCGLPIAQFGPANSNIFYHSEDRFIDSDNGGCNAYSLSTLSGVAYYDTNGNDCYNTGDTPLANVKITLTGTTGADVPVSVTTTTNSSGAYTFTGLAPGTYTVTETLPSGYTAEIANVGSVGGTAAVGSVSSINLNSNTTATSYNFGQYKGGSISGVVFVDANCDQTYDSGDAGLGGVTVNLETTSGTVIASTTTASNGAYSFVGLAPGKYEVVEAKASGYTLEDGDVGSAGGTAGVGLVTSISLSSGTVATGYNLGQFKMVSSCGYYCSYQGECEVAYDCGSFGSCNLGNWLAKNCASLCGSGSQYGNLCGQNNVSVLEFCQQLQNQCGANSLQCELLTAALDHYFGKC